jgi:hypothetical protein
LKLAICARPEPRAGFLFDRYDRMAAQRRPSWAPAAPAGRPQGPLRPEITAIVSFDVHCYLRFVRGASPLSLREKFSQARQIFIVLYNEQSCTARAAWLRIRS